MNNLNAKEPSLSNIIKKLESDTLSDDTVKSKGSCRYWYTFSKNAYSALFNYDINKKNGIFYKLQDATLKIHSKALIICKQENEYLYGHLYDNGGSACGNCLFRSQIENVPLVIKNTIKREEERVKKEKILKDDANQFINSLSKNASLSKKIKRIESRTLEDFDVHTKGTCTYWYRFVRNAYDDLLEQNIHKKNSIFFKLKDITLKLHNKALSECKTDNSSYYSYLNGNSKCGNCLSRQDILGSDSLIKGIEKQNKINNEKKKKLKEKEEQRKEDTNIFLESLK